MVVVFGRNPMSFFREVAVLAFARASSKRPMRMNVMMPQEESK